MDDRKLSHSQNFLKNPEFVESLLNRTDINFNDFVIYRYNQWKLGKVFSSKQRNILSRELRKQNYLT